MARTEPRPCPNGRHQLGPNARTRDGCLACQAEEATGRVLEIVVSVEPQLDREVIVAAVGAAAPSTAELQRLRAHLEAQPGALTSGSPWSPNVSTRLAHRLVAAGASAVVRPRCADCGRPDPKLWTKTSEGRICNNCGRRRRAVACSWCAKVKPVAGRNGDGSPLCDNCWRRSSAKVERCAVCGHPGLVTTRDGAGNAICNRCYRAPTRPCGQCRRTARIVSTRSGTPLCRRCYEYPLHRCGRCGRLRPLRRRGVDGEPGLCAGCVRLPMATCTVCGKHRRCHRVATEPVCTQCGRRRTHPCAHCGRERTATALWPEGAVCESCYGAALRRRGACAGCGEHRRLVDPPGPRAVRCADCAGIVPVAGHICSRCGIEDKLYERDLCPRCVLADRTTRLLAGNDGSVPTALIPLHRAIVDSPSTLQAIVWLRRSAASRLLADIRATGEVPTHELLDRLGPSKAVPRLRQLLVASGVLAVRPELIVSLERWLDDAIEAVEAEADRRLLHAYATWGLLVRIRRGRRGADISVGTASRARARFRATVSFLGWLAGRGRLATCAQGDIDEWLAHGERWRYDIREFVRWAAERGSAAPLEVPPRPWREGEAVSSEDRWAVAGRLLRDEGLELVDRVTGSFVLLYAQHLSRISGLTVDDVAIDGGAVTVRFGRDETELIPPLAALVVRLCETRRASAVGSPETRWLFHGQLPGQPISAGWLGQRLRRLGIATPTARRAALMQLGAELPAALMADLLGIAPNTAVRWVRAAGGDWANYAAERARAAAT